MNLPLVTIGAINYNNSPYVLETLNSIAAQTYPNIELIVVDDASTDDSLDKMKQWLTNYSRPYKLITHSKNDGVHKAYESVINNAAGEYLSFIATDDLLEPGKTEQQVLAFQQLDDDYGLVYGDVIEINEQSEINSRPYFDMHRQKNKDWQLPNGSVFVRVAIEFLIYVQSTLVRTSLLKEFSFRYKALSEDWQVILFLARHTKFFGINKVVVRYRRHALSLSTQNRRRERYYLWCRSNTLMFHEAYNFKENTKEDKRVIADRIEFHLRDYAYQPNSKYGEVLKTWRQVRQDLPFFKSAKLLSVISLLRVKLIVKKIFFPKLRRKNKLIIQA